MKVLKNNYDPRQHDNVIDVTCVNCSSELQVTPHDLTHVRETLDPKNEAYDVRGFICPCCNTFNKVELHKFPDGTRTLEVINSLGTPIRGQHTSDCGTSYRGCSPECTFHGKEE